MRCGALTFPTYRLVPDARWMLDVPEGRVRSRAEDPRPARSPSTSPATRSSSGASGAPTASAARRTGCRPASPPLRSGPFVVIVAAALLTAGFGDTAHMPDRNVLGGPLESCGTDPLTGFYRDGCCSTGPEDLGSHTICAVVTAEFLEHQRSIGNDLSTPMPLYGFPGLVPGDRWCVTAVNWLRAHRDGAAAYVVLASTHERALDIVPLDALREHAVDVPSDLGSLDA